jgi:bacterioferritin-associated ferredoxin
VYICLCNSITDSDIRHAAEHDGVRSMQQLKQHTGCSMSCGRCEATAREVLAEVLHERRNFLRIVSSQTAA